LALRHFGDVAPSPLSARPCLPVGRIMGQGSNFDRAALFNNPRQLQRPLALASEAFG
jgi:hypothetical protein